MARKRVEPNHADTAKAVEENIRRVVRMLMGHEGMSNRDLAAKLGIKEQSLSDRVRPHWASAYRQPPFRASEIKQLSLIFGVPVNVFYDEPYALTGRSSNNQSYYGKSGVLSGQPDRLAVSA